MDEKVNFKGFSCPSKTDTELKLNLGASMNQGDYFDPSIIKIGS
jgi:hypothetical protein